MLTFCCCLVSQITLECVIACFLFTLGVVMAMGRFNDIRLTTELNTKYVNFTMYGLDSRAKMLKLDMVATPLGCTLGYNI